jgi:hypothetical protein
MKKTILTFLLLALAVGHNAMAAISASVSASPSTGYINQPINFAIAISNTGASAYTITAMQLTSTYNGTPGTKVPAAYSVYNLGPNAPQVSVAALATTTVPMQAVFFSPSTGITNSGTGKYYVGSVFSLSDGSNNVAGTAAQVTIQPVPLPAAQRQ